MIDALPAIRAFVLATAVVQLFFATLFFDVVRRRILSPRARLTEGPGPPGTRSLRHERLWRAVTALMAVVPLALWWYLGTPDAADLLAHRSPIAPPRAPDPAEAVLATTSDRVRLAIAQTIPGLAVLAFGAYAFYLVVLERRIERYRLGVLTPGVDPHDPSLFHAQAAPFLARLQRLDRLHTRIWLGLVVVANLLYFLVKP